MQDVADKNKTLELLGLKRFIVGSVFCQHITFQEIIMAPSRPNCAFGESFITASAYTECCVKLGRERKLRK